MDERPRQGGWKWSGEDATPQARQNDARVGQVTTLRQGSSEHHVDASTGPHREAVSPTARPRWVKWHEGCDGVLRQPATDDGQGADGR